VVQPGRTCRLAEAASDPPRVGRLERAAGRTGPESSATSPPPAICCGWGAGSASKRPGPRRDEMAAVVLNEQWTAGRSARALYRRVGGVPGGPGLGRSEPRAIPAWSSPSVSTWRSWTSRRADCSRPRAELRRAEQAGHRRQRHPSPGVYLHADGTAARAQGDETGFVLLRAGDRAGQGAPPAPSSPRAQVYLAYGLFRSRLGQQDEARAVPRARPRAVRLARGSGRARARRRWSCARCRPDRRLGCWSAGSSRGPVSDLAVVFFFCCCGSVGWPWLWTGLRRVWTCRHRTRRDLM